MLPLKYAERSVSGICVWMAGDGMSTAEKGWAMLPTECQWEELLAVTHYAAERPGSRVVVRVRGGRTEEEQADLKAVSRVEAVSEGSTMRTGKSGSCLGEASPPTVLREA